MTMTVIYDITLTPNLKFKKNLKIKNIKLTIFDSDTDILI